MIVSVFKFLEFAVLGSFLFFTGWGISLCSQSKSTHKRQMIVITDIAIQSGANN